MTEGTAWVRFLLPRPDAAMRLFCFPFAGGGASAFRAWCAEAPDFIEVCPIQPPGREERYGELPFRSLPEMVDAAAADLRRFSDKPFALYGHSAGAITAFEIAQKLHRDGAPAPILLAVGAHRAPHLPLRRRTLHDLSDEELLTEIRNLSGTPAAVLEDRGTREYVLRVMRADLSMCENYEFVGGRDPLPYPIAVYGGAEDASVPPDWLSDWRVHTSDSFTIQVLPGDHFFLNTQRAALLGSLSEHILEGIRNIRSR